MPISPDKQKNTWYLNLALALLNQPFLEACIRAWQVIRKVGRGLADEGMYEVLEYETQLELLDPQGQAAVFRKRQKVQYRQNNIIAYQDQAWGDGDILIDYQCSPGKAVDYYRPDQKTFILIALHDVKKKGDVDEFHIQWGILNGFTRAMEQWGTEISHKTKKLKIQVIFPANRPPIHAWLVALRTQHKYDLEAQQLADGRWHIQWETNKPHLHEQYILKWDW
ncbi:MAG: hypothetical protein H6658_11505 [Ardenticatenaceae bacterium]|nr:hypothetical protein [Ardenticatenaceae bacterium]